MVVIYTIRKLYVKFQLRTIFFPQTLLFSVQLHDYNTNTNVMFFGDELVVRPQLNNLAVLKFQLNFKSRDYFPELEIGLELST